MASAKGDGRRKPHGRKPLIQPVLPALPVLSSKQSKQTASPSPKPDPAQDQGQPQDADLDVKDNGNTNSFPQKQPPTTLGASADAPEAVEELKELASESCEVSKPASEIAGHVASNITDRARQEFVGVEMTRSSSASQPLLDSVPTAPAVREASEDSRDHVLQQYPVHGYVNGVKEWAEEVSDEVAKETSLGKEQNLEGVQRNGVSSSGMSEHENSAPEVNGGSQSEISGFDQKVHIVNGAPHDTQPVRSSAPPPQESELSPSPEVLTSTPLPSISQHLLQLSSTKDWADWLLTVNPSGAQTFASYGHGSVLLRSPRLRALMERSQTGNFTGNVINLNPAQAIVPHAFEAALRFLYSDTVLSAESLLPKSTEQDLGPVRANLLSYIISYWISGIELGVEPVVTRSTRLFEELVGWDIAELAMKEAYELEAAVIRGLPDQQLLSSYADAAVRMQQAVLRFCINHISLSDFRIQHTAYPTIMRSRLGQLEEARSRHNPALAAMVFGSMPSSADLSPASPQSEILPVASSLEEQVGSNILLNVSFENLEYFAYQLGQAHGSAAEDLLSQIIAEREARRFKVVSNRNIPNKQRMSNSNVWEVAGFREFIQDGRVKRERVGFVLPTKQR